MAENTQQGASEIRYLNPVSVDVKKKKYCRFKKLGIKYVDYTLKAPPFDLAPPLATMTRSRETVLFHFNPQWREPTGRVKFGLSQDRKAPDRRLSD